MSLCVMMAELLSATGLEETNGNIQLLLCPCWKMMPWTLRSHRVMNKLVGVREKALPPKCNTECKSPKAPKWLHKAGEKGCVPPLSSGVGLKRVFSNPEEDLQEVIQI